jgi:hypothetical protein
MIKKEYRFEKMLCEDGIHILTIADNGWWIGDGWTYRFSPDGEVCTDNVSRGEEIPQKEAEKILSQYGWEICEKCGRIFSPTKFKCVCSE